MKNIFSDLLAPQGSAYPRQGKKHRGVALKSEPEIAIMRQAGAIAGTVLAEVRELAQPGVTTGELDRYAEARIRELGAVPSFKGYRGFPASLCVSINAEAVHGVPNRRRQLRSGDLLKVDTGAYFQGYHGDSCITIAVGQISAKAKRLMEAAEAALYRGIEQVKPGNRLMDIAGAIEDYVKPLGYSIVQDFTGHGVGRDLHEDPHVFNVRTRDLPNVQLKAGMTLAIEPIVNAGSRFTRTLKDRWTVVTLDNALSAQFEHTVLVTPTGYDILTYPDPARLRTPEKIKRLGLKT
ncbi:MAG: type I methionyl aminopeptidase [Cyanobacteria bacterium RI_101]|nr:type I methionyl aminopeptidase [Cyanobacteria bacterium RI_101]